MATTDETGALICQISYDPWGKSTATGGSCSAPSREYLSQESINTGALNNLINLNARVFDPVLARFMGADPITDTSNLQALNLYSYGLNSPLWISDPSGMHGQFWQYLGMAVSIGILIVAPYLEGPLFTAEGGIFSAALSFNPAAIGVLTANGAIAGAVGAGISGGNVLQGAEFGAISSGLAAIGAPLGLELADQLAFMGPLAATAGAFISQGFAGGLTSVIEGRNFGSGFLAAGVGSLVGGSSDGQIRIGGLIASAVVGGTASVLGGGKFENGAVTGAFAYVVATLAQGAARAPSDQLACNGPPDVCGVGSAQTTKSLETEAQSDPYNLTKLDLSRLWIQANINVLATEIGKDLFAYAAALFPPAEVPSAAMQGQNAIDLLDIPAAVDKTYQQLLLQQMNRAYEQNQVWESIQRGTSVCIGTGSGTGCALIYTPPGMSKRD